MKTALTTKYLQERNGGSKVSILTHPAFWFVLGLKAAVLFFFGSAVPAEQYAGLLSSVDFFILRVLVLVADLAIFLVLSRWLKDRQSKVLWYYWCSPILFAVNYVAGFLDIIPISLLFAFLYFLFKEKYIEAFLLLGLALAVKTGLVILLPFVFVYLLKEYEHPIRAVEYMLLSCSVYVLCNIGYLSSPVFWQAITFGGQSFASFAIDFGGTVLYVMPLVYAGLLVGSLAFQRLNRVIFLMFLAFALGIITLFVLPQAGWYAWIIPFFVYFFVKEERAERYPFVLLNVFYFAYFLLAPGAVFADIARYLPESGTAANVAFTLLQGALLLNIVWVFRLGIRYGVRHKILYKPYLVGIAGDSASGKSTVTRLISKVFGEHNTLEVAGDDMHKWERGDPHWSEFTHLNPIANRLHDDLEHAARLKRNESIVRNLYDHAVGRFTLPERVRPKNIIVFQGLHTLYLHRSREMMDLKIFLCPDEELRRAWKVERDTAERGSTPDRVLQQLEQRSADSQKYIQEQRKYADVLISIGQEGSNISLRIQCDNSIPMEPFISALKQAGALAVSHEIDDDSHRSVIEGDISREAVDELAYALVPDVWEINRRERQWEGGLNGVLQLFLVYVVFYKARSDHDAF